MLYKKIVCIPHPPEKNLIRLCLILIDDILKNTKSHTLQSKTIVFNLRTQIWYGRISSLCNGKKLLFAHDAIKNDDFKISVGQLKYAQKDAKYKSRLYMRIT